MSTRDFIVRGLLKEALDHRQRVRWQFAPISPVRRLDLPLENSWEPVILRVIVDGFFKIIGDARIHGFDEGRELFLEMQKGIDEGRRNFF